MEGGNAAGHGEGGTQDITGTGNDRSFSTKWTCEKRVAADFLTPKMKHGTIS